MIAFWRDAKLPRRGIAFGFISPARNVPTANYVFEEAGSLQRFAIGTGEDSPRDCLHPFFLECSQGFQRSAELFLRGRHEYAKPGTLNYKS